ncbi:MULTISPECIES: DNA cytosine methyltransferase [unclassified Marinobacter]|uniref:DNA cytosine methyltransferase n=1 Tax=unclassified Marinobacter TaxID=83889 RepID=UPI00126784AE|nr:MULTISPECIES: DNA cytosine methyltransferase [unclassified Marinobacter]QFS86598.1 C-5 cytosine-specific DNA methylase [Marinobacter sp. THAF197a]QFT50382.1 C-5 cytosine-specific DNA methylase [Marinobacter sp. THAF39]QFT52904.1 C-5 cytosine-specific DNA methylase [Marinobacter sp. THAF39]
MVAYYNEIDPYAAEWLRNLIAMGEIAPGVVDERSIEDVSPDDLREFTQCHFFAGIGVWSLALRRAGWPDDRPIWTGSCPCQPFSTSGKKSGFADERHLWPHWYWLIDECRPTTVLGEQVASKTAEPWFDLIQADLEALDYAFGCVPFPSAGIGAPNIRDRAYWVGHAGCTRSSAWIPASSRGHERDSEIPNHGGSGCFGSAFRPSGSGFNGSANTEHNGRGGQEEDTTQSSSDRTDIGLHNRGYSSPEREPEPGPTNGFWGTADWLFCRDGKWRPVEPGTFPLAHGAPARVGRLRAYGNAINAEAATVFIEAVKDTLALQYNQRW